MNITKLSDDCLMKLWFRIQRYKLVNGCGSTHALRCYAMQERIDNEQHRRIRNR